MPIDRLPSTIPTVKHRLVATLTASWLALWPQAAWSQTTAGHAGSETRPAEVGGLHRAAATLRLTLDVYRMALVEIVAASNRLREVDPENPPTPNTDLPDPVKEIFSRLQASVLSRVPDRALPVVSRGYHAEVLDAMDQLAGAEHLGEVVRPLRAMHRAMERIAREADSLLDLFSRQRPIQVRVIDPATVLDDINEALAEVALAERDIGRIRQNAGSLGEQLQAFLRLEVALGHALDLIAAAEEAGLHIGFEVGMSTTGLEPLATSVRVALQSLDQVLQTMEQKPAAITGHLWVHLCESGSTGGPETALRWSVPLDRPRPAAVRVYRRANIPEIQRQLATAYECEGKEPTAAAALAEAGVAELNDQPVLVQEQPAGRDSYAEVWEQMPVAPPIYRVAPVNAFGVEAAGPEATARLVPGRLEGPGRVRARALAPPPDHPDFYTKADAVEVSWQISANDLQGPAPTPQEILDQGLPVVSHYRVLRRWGETETLVREVPAGTTSFIDRPPLDLLAAGIRYAVESVTKSGERARPPDICSASPVVQAEVRSSWRMARLGLGLLSQPTRLERETYQRLRDRAELEKSRLAFVQKPMAWREEKRLAWWASVPQDQKVKWLNVWPYLLDEAGRQTRLQTPPLRWVTGDMALLQAHAWMAEQPPEIQQEVERWWDLLGPASQQRLARAWVKQLGREHRAAVQEASDQRGLPTSEADRDILHLWAWLEHRDSQSRAELDTWWQSLPEAARAQGIRTWYSRLPRTAQRDAHWPAWERLTKQEREHVLAMPPLEWAPELWRSFLSWLAWQELREAGGPALESQIRKEASWGRGWLASAQYALRPLDAHLGFYLGSIVAALAALGLLMGGLLLWRRQRS